MAYVDVERLSKKLRYIFKTYGVSAVIVKKVNEALNKSAADVVEVVRCKDCKHWNNGDCYRIELTRPSDFCSYGERRSE